jgi:CheY-like chemotaxis protein/tetratricopeptide (TPR) repeat protein
VALRILVVEDDKHVRRILESLLANEPSLKARSPEVVAANDGQEGLRALSTGPFDLVITDLLMPKMDGFQFCREVRKHRLGAQVPLIVTSAIYKDAATQIRLKKEVGDHLFFAKPYEIRDLIQAVNRILEGRGGEPEPPVGLTEVAESGTLAERGTPRLLLDLSERRVTGVLALQRGKVKKEIGFQTGVLVHCDSNLRTETLGHFLVSRGIIDEKQHQTALTRTQARRELFGQSLVELGWISEKDLLHQLAAQMRAKVASTLRWLDGEWSFSPGPVPARLQTPIDAALLIFLGLQKTAHVDDIAQLLAGVRGRLSLTPRAERHRDTFARVFGIAALEALARQPLLEDLMAGTDPAAMLVQLDALLTCGLAELQAPAADEPERSPAADPPASPDPVALDRITRPAQPAAPPPLQNNLYDQLFGDEPSAVHSLNDYQLKLAPDAEALRKEILTEYLALPNRNLYEILAVTQDAPDEALAEAYARMQERFRLERYADVDLGKDYARLEALHQAFHRARETLTHHRAEYDRSLAGPTDPSHSAVDAELLAAEAETLLAAGLPAQARAKLTEAAAAAPDVAHHHAHLGWATFLEMGDGDLQEALAAAWPHLEQALAIDPDDSDAHELAGRIAAAVGDDDRAIAHLERALDAAPARSQALTALEALYMRQGAHQALERRYRKSIHRLGENPERVELWARLAELYSTHLGDRESARTAYVMLAKLSPGDARAQAALDELGSETPEGHFQAHVAAQRWDAAFVAAALSHTAEAGEFYRRYRPRFLQRPAPLEPEQLWTLRHPDDTHELSELLRQAPALSLGALGVTDEEHIPYDFMPTPFRRALLHTAALFGLDPPAVFRRGDFAAEVSAAAADPPVLLAGPQALASADLAQLAFRLGRAFSYLAGRRAAVLALPAHQLAELLQSDVPRLIAAMERTADRLGLVACQDPALALELAHARDELAAWALSAAHLELRERLGVSVAV